MPAPMVLAGWWGDKFNRLYLNNVKTPDVKSVNADRRPAAGAPRRHHRERAGWRTPKCRPATKCR